MKKDNEPLCFLCHSQLLTFHRFSKCVQSLWKVSVFLSPGLVNIRYDSKAASNSSIVLPSFSSVGSTRIPPIETFLSNYTFTGPWASKFFRNLVIKSPKISHFWMKRCLSICWFNLGKLCKLKRSKRGVIPILLLLVKMFNMGKTDKDSLSLGIINWASDKVI